MEKSCLAEVKAILKSLVLSSTGKMTIDQLNRDYRDIEGEYIPFRRLGYVNIEQFLHAIPDTLKIFGSGPTAMVCFMADEKSVHIHDMIMQQKKPKTKAKSKSRVGNNSHIFSNKKYNNNMKPMVMTGHQLSPFQSINRQHAVRTVKVCSTPPLTSNLQNKTDGNQDMYRLPQPSGIVSNNAVNTKAIKTNDLQNSKDIEKVSDLMKSNLVITQPSTARPPLLEANKFSSTTNENESDLTKGSANEIIAAKTSNFLENIKAPRTKQKSSERIEKLMSMRKRINFSNHVQQNALSSKSEEIEKNVSPISAESKDLKLTKERNEFVEVNSEREEQGDEAVPSFAAKYNVYRLDFPKHTVSFGTKIAPYKISNDVTVDSCIKIFMSEIHSPFKFWFHLHKEDHELDSLMFDIERYYLSLDENELCIPMTSLIPGQVCAAKFNDMWHRAQIVAAPVRNTIKVSFMDYGTVCEVKIMEVKFLISCFAELPAQAIRGCLSHIKPRQKHWSHEATLHFLNLTSNQMLFAKISEIDTESQILYMIICNSNGDEVVQINKSLVDQRYAFYDKEWTTESIEKNNGQRLHHPREDFPTFSMIELGEYPNFSELFELQRRGIDYEAIYDMNIYNRSLILNNHEQAPEYIRKLPYFLMTTNPFRSDIILQLYATKSWAV